MSTFPGLIEEVPGCSCDRFDGANLNSTAFFLSHCHTDHMKGLNRDFFDHLQRHHKFLYCSHITKSFLAASTSYNLDARFVNEYLIELPLDDPRIIEYTHKGVEVTFDVSCITAGHCPGSVMFLFHTLTSAHKNILYTGDFRIHELDPRLPTLESLHKNGKPIHIDKMYLDTTFLDEVLYKELPSREDSARELRLAAKKWLDKDWRNVVVLKISANYGSEYIYQDLAKFTGKRIHVKSHLYEVYSRMEVLARYVTDRAESTRIHACVAKNENGLKCRSAVGQENILTIVPSVLKWAGRKTACVIEWDKKMKQTKNVCYSTHASYNELEAFIRYFKPQDIYPCVCEPNDSDRILHVLKKIMGKTELTDCSNAETKNPRGRSFAGKSEAMVPNRVFKNPRLFISLID